MCTEKELQDILKAVTKAYQDTYGQSIEQVLLYGSYARKTNSEYSDIDLVAIVHGDRLTLQNQLHRIWDVSSDLEIDHGIIISPTVIPYDEFEKYKDIIPYYRNIAREGVMISA